MYGLGVIPPIIALMNLQGFPTTDSCGKGGLYTLLVLFFFITTTTFFDHLLKDEIWYAVRTFNGQERRVSHYLEGQGVTHFIPTTLHEELDSEGHRRREYRPVVHNLLFVRRDTTREALTHIISDCPFPVRVYSHLDSHEYFELTGAELMELRLICDHSTLGIQVMTSHEADIRVGRMVKVTHGPLKGLTGKLVRKNKKYYVVKTFADLGIMVSVSRWCCKEMEE